MRQPITLICIIILSFLAPSVFAGGARCAAGYGYETIRDAIATESMGTIQVEAKNMSEGILANLQYEEDGSVAGVLREIAGIAQKMSEGRDFSNMKRLLSTMTIQYRRFMQLIGAPLEEEDFGK